MNTRPVTLLELRTNAGDIVDDAYHGKPQPVTRNGKLRAVVVSPADFDELTALRAAHGQVQAA